MNSTLRPKCRVGVLGYGKLGQYLVECLLASDTNHNLELAFVWNRSPLDDEARAHLFTVPVLTNLDKSKTIPVDLMVEVCHPKVVQEYACQLLDQANLMIGSPTALADPEFNEAIHAKLATSENSLYVARGALWGGNDIQFMAQRNLLKTVEITMHFHPRSLRLSDEFLKLTESDCKKDGQVEEEEESEKVLYDGPARELCALAPNNVNTIATAALIGLGFDRTVGRLVSNPNLCDYHKIEIVVCGKPTIDGKHFEVRTTRQSPTTGSHAVTSLQTYASFWHSLLQCSKKILANQNNPYKSTSNIEIC